MSEFEHLSFDDYQDLIVQVSQLQLNRSANPAALAKPSPDVYPDEGYPSHEPLTSLFAKNIGNGVMSWRILRGNLSTDTFNTVLSQEINTVMLEFYDEIGWTQLSTEAREELQVEAEQVLETCRQYFFYLSQLFLVGELDRSLARYLADTHSRLASLVARYPGTGEYIFSIIPYIEESIGITNLQYVVTKIAKAQIAAVQKKDSWLTDLLSQQLLHAVFNELVAICHNCYLEAQLTGSSFNTLLKERTDTLTAIVKKHAYELKQKDKVIWQLVRDQVHAYYAQRQRVVSNEYIGEKASSLMEEARVVYFTHIHPSGAWLSREQEEALEAERYQTMLADLAILVNDTLTQTEQ